MVTVLGMGNALVDMMIQIPGDDWLSKFNLPKGSMQLVDSHKSSAILNACKNLNIKRIAGGSASNTIFGLASLGASAAFIGKIGKDEVGQFYRDDLIGAGIKPVLFTGEASTGIASALVSPDSERTFGTYLGSAVELSASDLNRELFDGFDYFHIEGYLVQNHELMMKAFELASAAGCKISLDLASYNVVTENLSFLKELLNRPIGVLFANEEEARSFTNLEPEEALKALAPLAEVVVVKIGGRGALVKRGEEEVHVPALPVKPIDTTGAGDLFASGFLYALGNGSSLEEAAQLGTRCAAAVISVVGARPDSSFWATAKEE